MMHNGFTYWQRLAAIVLAILCAAPAAADKTDPPSIARCRIGFDGYFKVGHWTPVFVEAGGDLKAIKPTVELATLDSDGVRVAVRDIENVSPMLMYARVGRLGAPIEATLIVDGDHVLDRKTLPFVGYDGNRPRYMPLPATGELIVQIGPAAAGLIEAFHEQESAEGALLRTAVQISDIAGLPTDWYGYDAVDVLVLSSSDAEFCRQLTADERRLEALRRWLELGGRLVVCGGRAAPDVFAGSQPLAEFLPGKFVELARLPQTQSIENFAGSGDPVGATGVAMNIPAMRLADVVGRVEAYFDRGNERPLVVRAARGLGELTFVAVDLAEPPLAEWPGRAAFWRAVLRPYLASDDDPRNTSQKLVSLGYDDLAGALRQRLGRSFAGVQAIGFPLVTALVIGYVLLIGPANYFFAHKLTQRPWIAWWTLPLVVLGTCGAAMVLAGAAKNAGGGRMNTAELIDFDLATGRVRGTCWATLYSPQAERLDVALVPRLLDVQPVENAQSLVTWLGLPGAGLGGMHARGRPIDVAGVGYTQPANLEQLNGVPVLTAATKSLTARWDSVLPEAGGPPIAAELAVDDDGLVVGTLANDTGVRLANACLLYGQWGYRLGDLRPGRHIEVGPQLSAIRVKTIVARRAGHSVAAGRDVFLADRATADELLNLMMFYEAAGGEGFAGLPNRYQADCDLSRLLELDRAMLLAVGTGGGSQWTDTDTGNPLGSEQDETTVVYRFILPVRK